jgi:C-terminal processing protease CtpA/Prc
VGEQKDLGEIRVLGESKLEPEERGSLGMWATDDAKQQLMVVSVDKGGPADKAGVKVGDQIVSVDGRPVATIGVPAARELVSPERVKVGQTVQLGLKRKDEDVSASVTAVAAGDAGP